MMSAKILEFGAKWRARFARDPSDPHRYPGRAAYYSPAGLRCGSKVRHHWIVPDLIRFNGRRRFQSPFSEPSRWRDIVVLNSGTRVRWESNGVCQKSS
jgi:hypothetical protein